MIGRSRTVWYRTALELALLAVTVPLQGSTPVFPDSDSPLCPSAYSITAPFAFDCGELIQEKEQNWVFSPYSVSLCLSMVELGAGGKTSDEIRSTLCLNEGAPPVLFCNRPTSDQDFSLHTAQGLWVKKDTPILPSYRQAVEQTFQATIESVSFTPETCQRINNWIAQNTENKIQDLLSPENFNDNTRLLLASALYFQGSWQHPFNPNATKTLPFYLFSGQTKQTDFINQTGLFSYAETKDAKAVCIPFTSRCETCHPVCFFILPKENRPFRLTNELFDELWDLKLPSKVHVALPKFRIEQAIDLSIPLQSLGMQTAFTDFADFSNIDANQDLCLSQVLHKSFFSLDEYGVEAAAATAAAIMTTTSVSPIKTNSFIADHPFYFFLVEQKTKTLLFFGQYQTPERTSSR